MFLQFISTAIFLLTIPISNGLSLPAYSGPYGVGLIDVEVPVQNPRNITNTTFTSSGQPAFFLQTVLFSLYYPTAHGTNSSAPPHPWMGNPIDCISAGIVAYSNSSSITAPLVTAGLGSVIGNVSIPAAADAPLASGSDTFPILLFSVGDVTLRTWYSQYAGLLAAMGYVVAIIEHRDGSLACSIVEEKGMPNKTVGYVQASQLSAPVAGNASELILQQRSFRQAEVEETFQVLQSINNGSGQAVYNNNSRNEGQTLSSWGNRLDLKQIVMGGHSFGATLALQVLSDPLVPANAGLTFDPGKSSGPLNSNVTQSVVIPDSESWSAEPSEFYGQEHFEVVKSIAQSSLNKTGAGWFMTLLGSAHTSITDAPLLFGSLLLSFFDPTSSNITLGNSEVIIQQYVNVSVDLFEYLVNGSRSGVLASGITTSEFEKINLNATNVQGLFDGWEVHVAPSAKPTTSSPAPTSTVHPSNGSRIQFSVLAFLISSATMFWTL